MRKYALIYIYLLCGIFLISNGISQLKNLYFNFFVRTEGNIKDVPLYSLFRKRLDLFQFRAKNYCGIKPPQPLKLKLFSSEVLPP